MDEARLLSVLERIASALERLAPAITADEKALPFDSAEADEFNAATDKEQREFWAYLEAHPAAMRAFEEAGLRGRGDSGANYESEDQTDGYYDDDPWTREEHFERYGGTYAQDVGELSDEFIDIVLDGFPEAYWNLGWE